MKSEAELIVQLQEAVYRLNIEGHSHQADAVKQAIAALSGKKLVDAGAVVLSVEDARALDFLLTVFRVGVRLEQGFDEHNKLRIAIDRAEKAGEVTK
jgi:hypothetical protein